MSTLVKKPHHSIDPFFAEFRNSSFDAISNYFDKVFDDMFGFGTGIYSNATYPKADILNHGDHFLLISEIPGLNKEDLTVTVKDDTFIIQGCKNVNIEKDRSKYILNELKHTAFKRTFYVSNESVDIKNIKAKFDNGILEIKIPKLVPEKTEEIENVIKID